MIHQTRGIVLRKVKYGDTSLIVDIYTEALGLQTYIVNGVRSSRAKAKANHFNLMNILDLQCYHQPTKKINRIKEFSYSVVYQQIPFDFVRANIGVFMCELVHKSVREEEVNGPLFDFLISLLLHLDSADGTTANLHLYFAIQLTHYLGFGIADDFDEDVPYFDIRAGQYVHHSPVHGQYLEEILGSLLSQFNNADLEVVSSIQLNRQLRNNLLDGILEYYRYHIELFGEMKTHKVLREVFD